MTDRIVKVRLEGDSASLDSALRSSKKASDETTSALTRTSTAISKNKDAVGKLGTALKGAIPNAVALASSATTGTKAITGLASSVFAGAKAFGPWGLAIGIAGDAVVGYATAVDNAAEATRRLREEQRKESDERFARRRQEIQDTQDKRAAAIEANKAERRRLDLLQAQIDNGAELSAIEEALASHGRGKDTLALQKRETEIRAQYLRIQEDVAGAAALERDFHLHSLQVMEKKAAAAAKVKQSAFRMTPGPFIERDDSRDFAAGMRDRPALTRDAADPTEAAANTLDTQMRAIELQRATTGESIALIEQERNARLDLLNVQMQAATTGGEIAALKQEREQVNHDATLARIAQEQAAEEALMAKRQAIMAATESIANSGVQLGSNIAKLAGVNAKKREKIERGLGAGQAIVIGMLESVKAAAAFAQPFGVGIPEGLAHTAAAAVAFSTAAVLGSGAGSGGGGGSRGGGGSQGSTSSTSTAANGPAPYTGPIPGSPGPSTPSSGTSGSPSGGGTTNNVFYISGVIGDKRAVMREIDEGLGQLGHHRRPRR